MTGAVALRDRLKQGFMTALASAYDSNDALSAFWSYSRPLGAAKLNALGSPDELDLCRRCISNLDDLDVASFLNQGLRDDQIAQLRTESAELRKLRIDALSASLVNFISVLEELVETPPEDAFCQSIMLERRCHSCGASWRYHVWQIVNTSRRLDLEKAAETGKFTSGMQCFSCGATLNPLPFAYCNPRREEFILFWPQPEIAGREEAVDSFMKYITDLPVEVGGGNQQICSFEGEPVAVFQEPNVACITTVYEESIFIEIITDPIMYNVEYQIGMINSDGYFQSREEMERGNWEEALKILSRTFLIEPVSISFLSNIVACLKNLGKTEEATRILEDAERLGQKMLDTRVIRRLVRSKYGRGEFSPLLYRILKDGLPKEWGFDGLIASLRRFAE